MKAQVRRYVRRGNRVVAQHTDGTTRTRSKLGPGKLGRDQAQRVVDALNEELNDRDGYVRGWSRTERSMEAA